MEAIKEEEDKIVDELTGYDQWEPKVMKADKPIILDCYASWCAPCKKLMPILEQAAIDNEGKFKLVKMDIDSLP